MQSNNSKKVWFPGLNGLRFLAALTVVFMHIHSNQNRMGLPTLPDFPILSKGLLAVSFFFVLSGFLITYLLLREQESTGTVSVKKFYLRRVFRIWPLYFLVILAGIILYWYALPFMGIDFKIEYSKPLAILLYTFFGANLINSLYHVGGLLHVTWSIAVEEQFYLFWAPLAKSLKKNILSIAIVVVLVSLGINLLNQINFFGLDRGWQLFVNTLQFHYMGIGAVVAFTAYHIPDKLLQLRIFTSRSIQVLLYVMIVSVFFIYQKSDLGELILPLPLGVLFAWLIVNTAKNPKALLKLESPRWHYLGSISYGIYMLHMPVVYSLSFLFSKTQFPVSNPVIFQTVFYLSCITGTLILAGISFKFLEKPILSFGSRVIRNKPFASKKLQLA